MTMTNAQSTGEWIDVSVPIVTGMVHWPDNPPVIVDLQLSLARGDAANVTKISMGAHTGTHMDAPHHFFANGIGIDQVPFEAVIGPARVVSIADPVSIKRRELEPLSLQAGERIIFKTSNSARWQSPTFDEHFVYIAHDAADYLAEKRVQTVGVDYLSVGGYFADGVETHHALLGAGIWIIEGLNLSAVDPGNYELICLPLKLVGADGAPARTVLRRVQ